jgi:hypothetical protein|tara:strand:- start:1351 stop:1941 length:591 start_codon:yes stop_codon:yes gene_type:complete
MALVLKAWQQLIEKLWILAALAFGVVCVVCALSLHPREKVVTGVVICSSGDLIAQVFFSRGESFSPRRAVTFLLWGIISASMGICWYEEILSRVVTGEDIKSSLLKVVLDQFVFTPIFSCPLFYVWISVLSASAEKPAEMVRKRMWRQLSTAWKVWPLVHTLNFVLTPPAKRMYVVWTVGLGWSVACSLMATAKKM